MKLPRNVSGKHLASLLAQYGYQATRQTGSHLRLTTNKNGIHHITIPLHNPLKAGTLNGIINDTAKHHGLTKSEFLRSLFRAY